MQASANDSMSEVENHLWAGNRVEGAGGGAVPMPADADSSVGGRIERVWGADKKRADLEGASVKEQRKIRAKERDLRRQRAYDTKYAHTLLNSDSDEVDSLPTRGQVAVVRKDSDEGDGLPTRGLVAAVRRDSDDWEAVPAAVDVADVADSEEVAGVPVTAVEDGPVEAGAGSGCSLM